MMSNPIIKAVKSIKENVLKSFLELFIVIVGIFPGLLTNDWNANRDQSKFQKEVFISIIEVLYSIENNSSQHIQV